jgi:PAS domain S-box-containing protein
MKVSVHKILTVYIALVLLIVLSVVLITAGRARHFKDTIRSISYVDQEMLRINGLVKTLHHANEIKAALLARQTSTPSGEFTLAKNPVRHEMSALSETLTNPGIRQLMKDSLFPFIEKWIANSDQAIGLQHQRVIEPGTEQALASAGSEYFQQIITSSDRMQQLEEASRLSLEQKNIRVIRTLNIWLSGILLGGLILGTIMVRRIRSGISEQQSNEMKFSALLDAAPDATVIVNEKGVIQMINRQMETLFSYTRNELIGQPVEILIPLDLRSRHAFHRADFIKEAGVRTMGEGIELKAVKKNGESFPVEISLSPIKTKEGLLVSASIRDITDRKKAEMELKENEMIFTTYFYRSPIMKAISEAESGKIIEVNNAYANFTGYQREEMIGKTGAELKLAPLFKRESIISVLQKEGFVRDIEIEIFTRQGKSTWISASLDLINLKGRECLLTSAIDITYRRRSEDRFRALLDSAPDATVIVNEEGIIQMINNQTENLFGYTREELIGQPVEILIPSDLRNKHEHHRMSFVKAANVRSMGAGIELNAVKKAGDKFPVEISLSPIRTDEGMLVSASVRDISLRKGLEDQLRKSNAELEAFTYSVSHDLRAPLRGIIGFTAILEEDYASRLDSEALRLTGVIKTNTLRMGHLIDDLLAFSRMGKQELTKNPINMDSMVAEIVEEQVQQNRGGNTIAWDIRPLAWVNADLNTIRQVWINLISNAVKYSRNNASPRIEISSLAGNRETIYFVKDNGVGFDEQYKKKLFKVFQRLHSPEEFEGTGVGLALVERIVSRHGGRVWAEGKEDEGAIFYFSLPTT